MLQNTSTNDSVCNFIYKDSYKVFRFRIYNNSIFFESSSHWLANIFLFRVSKLILKKYINVCSVIIDTLTYGGL